MEEEEEGKEELPRGGARELCAHRGEEGTGSPPRGVLPGFRKRFWRQLQHRMGEDCQTSFSPRWNGVANSQILLEKRRLEERMMELKVFSSFLLSSLHNLSTKPACVVSWARVSKGEREDYTTAKNTR